MKYNVLYTSTFRRELKKLSKKYTSLNSDLDELITSLEEKPIQGTPKGKKCYKIRMAISSKVKGKSGGARVITHVKVVKTEVHLLIIYDKSEKDDLTDKELRDLLNEVNL